MTPSSVGTWRGTSGAPPRTAVARRETWCATSAAASGPTKTRKIGSHRQKTSASWTKDLDVCCCFRPYEDKKNWFSQAENFRELDEGSGPKTTASSTTKPVCLAFRQLPRGLHVVHLSMAITSRLCLHPTCCPTLPLHPLPPAPFDDSPWRLSSLSHQSSLRSSPLILSCHLVDPWGVLPPAPPSLLTASRMLHTLTSLLMVS